ncbi:MAG TPA: DUF72 domain-containing protein [Acidobacteriota bacterium]|jgi:uncharacterized protein YecE (DUF72 family)
MIYFGTAGWVYRDWEGKFYPQKKPRGFDPLLYLSKYFDTVEINSSFYYPPQPEAVAKWVQRVQENKKFRFTAKLWKKFTHERSFTEADLDEFKRAIDPLLSAGKLGAMLLQFPWSFKNEDQSRDYLVRLIENFPDYPLVLEVRHESWNLEATFDLLRQMGVGFCNIDQPRIGRSLRPTAAVTSGIGYYRLHGRNYKDWFRSDADVNERYDYLYSSEELQEAEELTAAISERARDTYVILNNHRNAQAPGNALELKSRVAGRKVIGPETLLQTFPNLKDFAEPEQAGLFG